MIPKTSKARRLLGDSLSNLHADVDPDKVVQYAIDLCASKYWKPGPADKVLINSISWKIHSFKRSKDHKLRISLATTLCAITNWTDYDAIHELSFAHADAGDFGEALKWAIRVVELAPEDDKSSYNGYVASIREQMAKKKTSDR